MKLERIQKEYFPAKSKGSLDHRFRKINVWSDQEISILKLAWKAFRYLFVLDQD